MDFTTAQQLIDICNEKNLKISEVMIERETNTLENDYEDTIKKMEYSLSIMKSAIETSLKKPVKSMGGLIGGEAQKINNNRLKGNSLCGSLISKAIAYAMGTLEVNASMGLIVAAVTAGSSGVLPGVLVSVQEEKNFSDEEIVKVMFNAAAIGYLISRNATVSGAEGGCQAEVGAASAMAASALVELMGGTPEQCLAAAGTALTNIMGLICDPIAGLVECPCQSRNAIGATNAFTSAEIALSGVKQCIPFDEIVEAMYSVGRSLPRELRETALGGVAATPTGCRLKNRIFGD